MMRALLLASAVVLGWAGSAHAIVMEYTSQAAFNAAVPGLATNGFSGFNVVQSSTPSPYTFGPLTFTSAATIYLTNDNGYGTGVRYVELLGNSGAVTVGLISQRNAVSFNIGTYGGADAINISVNGAVQLPVASVAGHPTTTFIGFTNTDFINTVSFSSANRNELDFVSFQIGQAATSVPEPASLALLGLGVAGIAAMRRRQVG